MQSYRRSKSLLLKGYSKSLHDSVESGVRQEQYSPDAASGFRIVNRRTDCFLVEHIERQLREESTTDPFGEVTSLERTVYVITTILVRLRPPHIIMLDPPTTSQKVIHRLCGYVDFQVPVVNPDLNVRSWAKRISSSTFQMRYNDIRIRDVDWGDGFSGSLSVSGEGDVFRKTESLTIGRKHSLTSIAGMVQIDEKQTKIRIDRTGRVELAKKIDAESHSALYELANW